jgi:hypothetical protein
MSRALSEPPVDKAAAIWRRGHDHLFVFLPAERQIDLLRHDYLRLPGIAALAGVPKLGIGGDGWFAGKRLLFLAHIELLRTGFIFWINARTPAWFPKNRNGLAVRTLPFASSRHAECPKSVI